MTDPTESTYSGAVIAAVTETIHTATPALTGAPHAPEDCPDQNECQQDECWFEVAARMVEAAAIRATAGLYDALGAASRQLGAAAERLDHLTEVAEEAGGCNFDATTRTDIAEHLAAAARSVRAARAVLATRMDRPGGAA